MATASACEAEVVRAHVLSAHAQLRAHSAELASDALRIARSAIEPDTRIRALVFQLWSVVEETDQLERRELFPLLENADAWGPARVAKLDERHTRHQRELSALADELGERRNTCDLAQRVDAVLRSLLSDLDDEEATSLEPDLLASDGPVVVCEQTSG